MQGILIAIEGVDGAGKTTQANLLAAALRQVGETVVQSKEPTGGVWGQRIRESSRNGRMDLEEEIEAFRQDRLEHVTTLIKPSLEAGKTVILDRYFYSFIAYQGARGASLDHLTETSSFAPVPDVVFLLDIDPRISVTRITESRGEQPNEFEGVQQLRIVRRIFQDVIGAMPEGVLLDGTQSIVNVQMTIAETLLNGVLKHKRCAKPYGCDDHLHCGPRMTNECEWFRMLSIKPRQDRLPALIHSFADRGVR